MYALSGALNFFMAKLYRRTNVSKRVINLLQKAVCTSAVDMKGFCEMPSQNLTILVA